MKLQEQIKKYIPFNEQEEKDKEVMLDFIKKADNILIRDNKMAHFTASSWIWNKEHTKILMIYHNIYDSWSWTGGHADGEADLLKVALREAKEETGIKHIYPVSEEIFSLEILTVEGHKKRGEYIPAHLHINITYLFEADEEDSLFVKEDENSGVKWFEMDEVVNASSEACMRPIYQKLNDKAIIQNAMDYLEKKPLLHMGMLEVIRRGHATILYAQKDGVLLFEKKSGAYMLSTEEKPLFKRLINEIDSAELFTIHQPFGIELLKERFGFQMILDCVQAVYDKKEPCIVTRRKELDIRCLGIEDASFVKEHYHTVDDDFYIKSLIEEGAMYGAYVKNKLVGFIGQHAEGSMGLLEVLPEYKRQGIGRALEAFLINQTIQKGNIAFCQVVEGNEASLRLQKSLSMKLSKEHVYWTF